MTLLVAEDNWRMRDSIKRVIQNKLPDHHTIYEANDGGAAIALYSLVRPDWVVMDIRMEPIDGLVASKKILAAHPGARILILTSYDDEGYRRAAKEIGVKAFVLKDRIDDIPRLISGVLEHR